jgi:lysophospholipase L1-like esterase
MDRNLTQSILPRLEDALGGAGRPVDFVLLNYYDPFANVCPDSLAFVGNLNAHLAADAAPFHVPVVDVYGAFGGDAHAADLVCTYTWYCDAQYHHDYHPTSAGYRAIAQAVERVLSSGSVRGGAIVPAIPPFNWLG